MRTWMLLLTALGLTLPLFFSHSFGEQHLPQTDQDSLFHPNHQILLAAFGGDFNRVKESAEKVSDPAYWKSAAPRFEEALQIASAMGHTEIVEHLLQKFGYPKIRYTVSPLMVATSCGKVEVMKKLLNGGWGTALDFAISLKEPRLIDLLRSNAAKTLKELRPDLR